MTAPEPVHIHADHDTVKRLGHWTTAREYAEGVRRAHRIGIVPTVDDPARTGGAGR
jgi:hypothetical protein